MSSSIPWKRVLAFICLITYSLQCWAPVAEPPPVPRGIVGPYDGFKPSRNGQPPASALTVPSSKPEDRPDTDESGWSNAFRDYEPALTVPSSKPEDIGDTTSQFPSSSSDDGRNAVDVFSPKSEWRQDSSIHNSLSYSLPSHVSQSTLWSFAIIDAMPRKERTEEDLETTFGAKPTQIDIYEIKKFRDIYDSIPYSQDRLQPEEGKDIEKFIEDKKGSNQFIVVVGHNENGDLVLPSGKKAPIEYISQQCKANEVICIIVSCNSKKYITKRASIGVDCELSFSHAAWIIKRFAEMIDGVNREVVVEIVKSREAPQVVVQINSSSIKPIRGVGQQYQINEHGVKKEEILKEALQRFQQDVADSCIYKIIVFPVVIGGVLSTILICEQENCDLRLRVASNGNHENEIIRQFKMEFDSKKKECAVLIVRATSNSEKWTIAGFDDTGEFRIVVIDDPNHELLKELKKKPRNERRIVEMATSNLGRTQKKCTFPYG